ncbi:biotin-dependent carboxyltransferase family protein [Pseudohoeflea coraliihabitans]|uniref:Biotin-dependent carboxyltransferase family protein n=1 Tax=Pseudohoeflea coraliihabitans TaxID=2860393 RepID=A0ABS6WPX4_9HYPH|nr:biotin-dependent carboxyltransferase family protein [Pseudohoeflea sp. DP4N28-3]MBW3097820.1 biotin-dependent carboxyltransferase family protein [Pseudohoeflea sp. DP4N28-3]
MPINVLSAGIATTIQDLGRPGYYHLGIPMGGAMDRLALRAANLLVGNDEGAAGLESVFVGPELEFTEDALVAVCGAELPPRIDGETCPTWTALKVKAGQVLSFDFLQSGSRAYIAISGGIDTPPMLGSRSTYAIGALGGIDGRAVQPGDTLPVGPSSHNAAMPGRSVPEALRRGPGNPAELRVLPGLYWHRITEQAQDNFFADEWKVANEADRMGYRFQGGRKLEFVERRQPFGAGADPSNITDACYPYGSVQVPSGTEPIILHRDAVSGGGYFMIGTVISADMDLIGQMQPHTATRFIKVDMKTALEARQQRTRLIEQIRQSLA